jgi:hypothetical protein
MSCTPVWAAQMTFRGRHAGRVPCVGLGGGCYRASIGVGWAWAYVSMRPRCVATQSLALAMASLRASKALLRRRRGPLGV